MENKKREILKKLGRTRQIKKSEFEQQMDQLKESTLRNKEEVLANFKQNYEQFLLEMGFIV